MLRRRLGNKSVVVFFHPLVVVLGVMHFILELFQRQSALFSKLRGEVCHGFKSIQIRIVIIAIIYLVFHLVFLCY